MALARLELTTIQRSRGRSVTAAAAYRAGARITDRRSGEISDFRRRTGVVSTALYGPLGEIAGAEREAIWNEAEAAERRRDSVVGREMLLALPTELSTDQRAALVCDFAIRLAREEGVIVDAAIHEPARRGDARNHHAHLLFSTRLAITAPDGATTFGAKTKIWDNKLTGGPRLTAWRQHFEDLVNSHLARAGSTARIDMRSLAAQGIKRSPGCHDGPLVTQTRRELASVRSKLARARTRLDGLALACRLGADVGLVEALAASMRGAVATLRRQGDVTPDTSVGRPPSSPTLDR